MIDLARFDVILVQSSAGKDSHAQLDEVVRTAQRQGVLSRVRVLHCELPVVEWPGVVPLAARQAAHYGVRFAIRRQDWGLLDLIARRRLWPSAQARYCTSDQKKAVGGKYVTELLRTDFRHLDRPLRVLNCLGMRAAESPARARRTPLRTMVTNSRRQVTEWLPVHGWTLAQVWARVDASGIDRHWAYSAGMSRLSCSLCPLASRRDLLTACRLRPDLAAIYADLEARIGHRFQHTTSMRDLIAMSRNPPASARHSAHHHTTAAPQQHHARRRHSP